MSKEKTLPSNPLARQFSGRSIAPARAKGRNMSVLGTDPIALIWIVANPVLIISLVLVPRIRATVKTGRQSPARSGWLNLTVGGLCLLLALVNAAVALQLGRGIPLLQGASAVSPPAFWASAVCYVVSAWALLRDGWRDRYSK